MDRYAKIRENILMLCRENAEIKAVIAIGSQVRTEQKADEYSDLDLFFICDEPDVVIYSDRYTSRFGNVKISFIEDTIGGGKERRILLDGSLDVDIIPMTPDFFRRAVKENIVTVLLTRGYSVIFDRCGCTELLSGIEVAPSRLRIMSESEFINRANDFFFHTVWARKKILRGELWTAKMCVDAYLKQHLLQIIQLCMVCRKGGDYDVWHDGRMLEKWADRDIVDELRGCFAGYDRNELTAALKATYKLFSRLSAECAEKLGYEYPAAARDYAGEFVK